MKSTTGRRAFIELLLDEGVSHLFGNPGTTELAIMEAVPQYPQLKFVLGLQEAVVVAMADGFARASGRLAAANVHVMPGLGNAPHPFVCVQPPGPLPAPGAALTADFWLYAP